MLIDNILPLLTSNESGPPNELLRRGTLMKIKRGVSNLLILVSPGGTTTVCIGEKFVKIQVSRFPKIDFLTHFLL